MAIGVVAMALVAGGRAQASVVTYTDRALFEAALSPFTVYNFNNVVLPANNQLPLDSGYDFGPFSISQPAAGATAIIRIAGVDGDVDGSNFVRYAENSSGSTPLIVTFDAAVQAFGFDYNNTANPGATNTFDVNITILGANYVAAAAGAHGFFGAISTDASMTQTVFNLFDDPPQGSGNIGLDNFTWGTPSAANAVPLPGALPLFGSGLVVVGLIARRRKKRAAA